MGIDLADWLTLMVNKKYLLQALIAGLIASVLFAFVMDQIHNKDATTSGMVFFFGFVPLYYLILLKLS